MSKRPIVTTSIPTEFGPVFDDPETLLNPTGMNSDLLYVPGFSDLRREADLARAEKRAPKPLPANVRWARRQNSAGIPNSRREIEHKHLGFRPVTKKDLGQPWFKDMPPSAFELPDGSIANADYVLMVQDAKAAAKRAAQKAVAMVAQNTDRIRERFEQAGAKIEGANPEVSVELGPERK